RDVRAERDNLLVDSGGADGGCGGGGGGRRCGPGGGRQGDARGVAAERKVCDPGNWQRGAVPGGADEPAGGVGGDHHGGVDALPGGLCGHGAGAGHPGDGKGPGPDDGVVPPRGHHPRRGHLARRPAVVLPGHDKERARRRFCPERPRQRHGAHLLGGNAGPKDQGCGEAQVRKVLL
ncbi:hypothetical protein IWQ56_003442, partial [Coemansia nantahalensis]